MLTSVVTHATGDVLPASDWNTGVRDNINFVALAGADLASAATVTPTNETHLVTGTTTIDNVSTTGALKGQRFRMVFQATIAVRHNGGGTGNIRLAGGLHAGFVANESITLVYDGTNWIETHRSPLQLTGQSIVYSGPVTSVPTGYLVEDGSAVSRTTLAAWFANVGTLHGAGDGSTTVNLPDTRARTDVGFVPSGGHADVATIGNNEGVATLANRRVKHRHSVHTHTGGNDTTTTTGSGGSNPSVGSSGSALTGAKDGGSGVSTDALDAPAYYVRAKLTRI